MIKTALDALADGFVDLVSILCSSTFPSNRSVPANRLFTKALEAIRNNTGFDLFNTTQVPPNATFPVVTFEEGLAPHPVLLTIKSCNSHVNIKYRQGKIPNLAWNGDPKMTAVAVPSCLDVDEDGGTCSLCRETVSPPDPYSPYEDTSVSTHDADGMDSNSNDDIVSCQHVSLVFPKHAVDY